MKFRLMVVLLALALPGFAAAQKKTYVGYEYTGVNYGRKLPNGVRDLGGNLLDDESYGVSRMKKGASEMLWLSSISGRNRRGVPRWQVRDVIFLPTLKKGQEILRGFKYPCTLDGTENLDLIVLAQFNPRKNSYTVNQAWRANSPTKKFEVLPVEGIVCAVGND